MPQQTLSSLDWRVPSLVDYFKLYVDKDTDLTKTNPIPCPFHKETHGKSFSITKDFTKWRCFGACHCGGDVIDLHKLNFHLKSRDEAKRHLYSMLNIPTDKAPVAPKLIEASPNEAEVRYGVAYGSAISAAKTVDDWIELDYIMSQYPVDVQKLEIFANARRNKIC